MKGSYKKIYPKAYEYALDIICENYRRASYTESASAIYLKNLNNGQKKYIVESLLSDVPTEEAENLFLMDKFMSNKISKFLSTLSLTDTLKFQQDLISHVYKESCILIEDIFDQALQEYECDHSFTRENDYDDLIAEDNSTRAECFKTNFYY